MLGYYFLQKTKMNNCLLSQSSPSSRQHHRLLSLCRVFENRSESAVPRKDRLYPLSRGTRMTSTCPSLIRSPIMNLPASLWLVNFSLQIRPLINALLETFTTTPWRQVQEYVSQKVLMRIPLPWSSIFFLAKLAVDDKKSSEECHFWPSCCYLFCFFLRTTEIESETIKNYITGIKLYPNRLTDDSKAQRSCRQFADKRTLLD